VAPGALTVPPAEDEVARAAARISDGALGDATIKPWPSAHDHHADHLTARDGTEDLFTAARMRHPRMRRYVHVAALLKAHAVPHPALRWYGMDKDTATGASTTRTSPRSTLSSTGVCAGECLTSNVNSAG